MTDIDTTATALPAGARWATIEPGDQVLVTLPDTMTDHQVTAFMDAWNQELPGVRMIALVGATALAVVRPGCSRPGNKITPESKGGAVGS